MWVCGQLARNFFAFFSLSRRGLKAYIAYD